jgi:hypothetical protein
MRDPIIIDLKINTMLGFYWVELGGVVEVFCNWYFFVKSSLVVEVMCKDLDCILILCNVYGP